MSLMLGRRPVCPWHRMHCGLLDTRAELDLQTILGTAAHRGTVRARAPGEGGGVEEEGRGGWGERGAVEATSIHVAGLWPGLKGATPGTASKYRMSSDDCSPNRPKNVICVL